MLARWVDGCAAIFPRSSFEELAEKVSKTADLGRARQGLLSVPVLRFLRVETDQQGRILLPAATRSGPGSGRRRRGRRARSRRNLGPGSVGEVAAGRQLGDASRART